jgi:hypothetical protein
LDQFGRQHPHRGTAQGRWPTGGIYKEISLTGDTGTSMVQLDSGKKEGSQQGYASGKNWAAELKRNIRSGRAKPHLVVLFGSSTNDANPGDLAMAYSFSRFLQSSPPRLAGLSKLMEVVRTSKAIRDPDGAAPFLDMPMGRPYRKHGWRA